MTTTGPRRGRTRLLVATVALALVAGGGLLWLADDTDWFLHRRLGGVDGVAVAGGRDGGTWVRLETSVDSRERPTVLAALSDVMRGEGFLSVGPSAGPEQPERSDGAPTTYVELGPGTTRDDLDGLAVALGVLTALESLESLRDEPDRQVVIGPGVEGLEMTATVEGDPGDLPFQAVQLVRSLASADASAVTQLDLEVGIAAGAGALRATCADGLAGPDGVVDALEDLDAAQGPGWAVGTAITCEGPSVAELLVQDAEDLAAQRRRAARVLPRDWALTVGWVGAEVSGRGDLDDDPAAVLRALRERDGAQLGPLAADLSSVEVAVDDVDGLGRVVRRLDRAGAGRVEVDLGEQVVAGPVGRLGPRLAALGRLEELGWEPGFVVLRDGSEVWSVSEAGADLAEETDREALVDAWRAGAGPGESRYLVERPDEDGLLLPALVFDSAPGSGATEVDDLVVLRDLESREAAQQVLAAWDATAGS